MRLRLLAPVLLVLALTAVGFVVAREVVERNAREEAEHRADIAATEARAGIDQATDLVESLRRFMLGRGTGSVTNAQLLDLGARSLAPVGLSAAAWVQQVPKTGLRATLVTGASPMTEPGLDLSGETVLAAAVADPRALFQVAATPLARARDGRTGLYLVQSAPRLDRGSLEPGFVVLFVPASWLATAVSSATEQTRATLQIRIGDTSYGGVGNAAAVARTFSAAGRRFEVLVPQKPVTGAAATLPWLLLGVGLVLAGLAGTLGAVAERRGRAQREVDRIFSLSPDVITVAGFDGYWKRVNPAFEKLFGYTEREALSQPYLEFVHQDDRQRTQTEVLRVAGGETTLSFENRLLCKDGTHRWIEWTATAVAEEGAFYGLARDVTERRQTASEQAALRRIATLAAEGADPDALFAAVAEQVATVIDVPLVRVVRYETNGTASECASFSREGLEVLFGPFSSLEGTSVLALVREGSSSARIDDYSGLEGEIAEIARRAGIRSAVGSPIVVAGQLWGAVVASSQEQLPDDTEARLADFTDLLAVAIADAESREALRQLADEQASLQRVATLVAQGVPPAEIFSAVSQEVAGHFGSDIAGVWRFEAEGPANVVVGLAKGFEGIPIGTRSEPDDATATAQVYRTGRSARDNAIDWSEISGPIGEAGRRLGIVSSVVSPIVVEGRVWGAMSVASTDEPLPIDAEERLEKFTALVGTAIANADSREALALLADQQAALRRVATLVARGVEPAEMFGAVTEEVSHIVDVPAVSIVRYEPDGAATELANYFTGGRLFAAGVRMNIEGTNILRLVQDSGAAARIDDYSQAEGEMAEIVRRAGIRSTVGVPIVVAGRLWGTMVGSTHEPSPLPHDTAARLADFTELLATAIENAESKEALERLADQQAALRRVATLVAQGVPPQRFFAAVSEEVGQLLDVTSAAMGRFDSDGLVTTVAAWSAGGTAFPVGRRWAPEGKNVTTLVFETRRSARMDDFADASGPVGEVAREAGYASAVGAPIIVDGHLWGVMTAASTAEEPLPRDTEARITAFTELVATAIANTESRAAQRQLSEEQEALRRVATLIAQQPSPDEIFTAVTEAVGPLLGADLAAMHVFTGDGTATTIAGWSAAGPMLPLGMQLPLDGDSVVARIFGTRAPARMDAYGEVEGETAAVARNLRLRSTVGAPILVQGELWGALMAATRGGEPLSADAEARLASFTELVATAIANTESRAALRRLAEQQAALRRVATVVAEAVPPAEVFSTISEEVNGLLDAQTSAIVRLEPDGTATVVVSRGTTDTLPAETELTPQPGWILTSVIETGQSARNDENDNEFGMHSSVAAPIVVEGTLWGVMVVGRERTRFPDGAEQRLEEFTDLAATAIANAEARAELTASRARIVTASDEARRRIERDLHDGAQQRLVTLSLSLRNAELRVPPEEAWLRDDLARAAEDLESVLDDLREISRGIHPAILSEGGLGPALKTLARRAPVPVEVELLTTTRLPEPIEAAAYYVAAEALTNAARYAQATEVSVAIAERNGTFRLSIGDDGVGGADPRKGSGLIGLRDRVEALGGTLELSSSPGYGTQIVVEFPVAATADDTPVAGSR